METNTSHSPHCVKGAREPVCERGPKRRSNMETADRFLTGFITNTKINLKHEEGKCSVFGCGVTANKGEHS